MTLNEERSGQACVSRLALRPTIYITKPSVTGEMKKERYTYQRAIQEYGHKITNENKASVSEKLAKCLGKEAAKVCLLF